MKYTVTLPAQSGTGSDVFLVAEWRKEIGEMVAAGDVLAVLRSGTDPTDLPIMSPAFGLLARKIILPGEALEVGEPLAILSGVPDSLLTGKERVPETFAARPPYVPGGPEELVTLSLSQRAVAAHMARSAQTSPHVYTFARVDVGEVLSLAARRESGLVPFVVSVVATALTRHPSLNAERAGDTQIRRKHYVHLGIGLRTKEGELRVPVIRDADQKSLRTLIHDVGELTAAVHAGATLAADTQRGATFTVFAEGNNLTGIHDQTLLIPQPHAASLRIGSVARTPVALPDDTLAVRPLLGLCLAHDARAVTDEAAAAFLSDVKTELEDARFLFR